MKKTKIFIALSLVVCMLAVTASLAYGCGDTPVRTPGYWKTHLELVTPKLSINLGCSLGEKYVQVTSVEQAKEILSRDDSSNGILKLYCHLFAAKLNLAYGTDDTAIWEMVEEIDIFLRNYGPEHWDSLSKEAIDGYDQTDVINWIETLDAYNNGLLGPAAAD